MGEMRDPDWHGKESPKPPQFYDEPGGTGVPVKFNIDPTDAATHERVLTEMRENARNHRQVYYDTGRETAQRADVQRQERYTRALTYALDELVRLRAESASWRRVAEQLETEKQTLTAENEQLRKAIGDMGLRALDGIEALRGPEGGTE